MPRKPLVALVGRPNVGKSTLFNRMVGQRISIVEDIPGTTRDRLYADVEWGGRVFTVIDTGGLVLETRPEDSSNDILPRVRAQAQIAIDEADVIVMLTDIEDGLTAPDLQIADLLRRTDKPIILVSNKVDNRQRALDIHEFYSLGLGDPLSVSALRGTGTGDLLDAIAEALPPMPEESEEESKALHIALVGRTNVGKSSLLNRFLGEERVIVSHVPGTTRDAIDTTIQYHGEEIVLIDTAGIRRRGKVEQGIEKYSVLRAMRAIQRADVVCLVIDASDGITAQDTHVAGYILEENKSVIVLVNKWDLVEKDSATLPQYEAYVRNELKFMDYVPILFISAISGQRVARVLPLAQRIYAERLQRLSTSQINAIIREATGRQSPPTHGGRKLRIYYGTQTSIDPPTFVFFVNDAKMVHFAYQRFLENQIRQQRPFEGSPLKMIFRDHTEKEEE